MILLFVGGMIVLMVRTNSGFTYPGYIIYLSALYTFYTMITVVVNVVKFRKSGSPYFVCCQNIEFYISYDVDSRFTDGNDISLFRKWRQLP